MKLQTLDYRTQEPIRTLDLGDGPSPEEVQRRIVEELRHNGLPQDSSAVEAVLTGFPADFARETDKSLVTIYLNKKERPMTLTDAQTQQALDQVQAVDLDRHAWSDADVQIAIKGLLSASPHLVDGPDTEEDARQIVLREARDDQATGLLIDIATSLDLPVELVVDDDDLRAALKERLRKANQPDAGR